MPPESLDCVVVRPEARVEQRAGEGGSRFVKQPVRRRCIGGDEGGLLCLLRLLLLLRRWVDIVSPGQEGE